VSDVRDGAPGHVHRVQGDGDRVPGGRNAAAAAAREVERHLVAEDADAAGPLVGHDHGLRDGHRHGEVPGRPHPGAHRLHQPRPHGDVQQHPRLHRRRGGSPQKRTLRDAHFSGILVIF